jgi:hypothetical protein
MIFLTNEHFYTIYPLKEENRNFFQTFQENRKRVQKKKITIQSFIETFQ